MEMLVVTLVILSGVCAWRVSCDPGKACVKVVTDVQ